MVGISVCSWWLVACDWRLACWRLATVVGGVALLRIRFSAWLGFSGPLLPRFLLQHDSTGRPFHPHSFLKSNIRCHLLTVDRLKIVFSILDSDFWILSSDVFESAGIGMIHHIVDTVLHCVASFIS